MEYKLRRFPMMSCHGREFAVALKTVRFGEICHTPHDICQVGYYTWDVKAVVSGTVFPKWNDYDLHPLMQFLQDNPGFLPRKQVYLHLPEATELYIHAFNVIGEKDSFARFELIGYLVPTTNFLRVDDESYLDFHVNAKTGLSGTFAEFSIDHFYLDESV